MALNRAPDQKGIALFMVIASMSILSILVTEFTYIAQMNQTLAFDGLDQLKAHYLAKSGVKLSFLRLKAFQHVKSTIAGLSKGAGASPGEGAAAIGISPQVLDKIWSFPFFFPVPTEIPGITEMQKEAISKFQKETSFEGKLAAVIESEGSKFNINSIHESYFASPSPSPSASPTSSAPPLPGGPRSSPSPSPSPFSPEEARDRLKEFMLGTLNSKIESDQEFAESYRDFKFDDFMDNLFTFADRMYERKTPEPSAEDYPRPKRGALTSISELRMVPLMDDTLFDLFSPVLTAAPTAGIHLNSMKEPTLRALVPGIKPEEATEFFKYRDSTEEDHSFKNEDEFFDYLQKNVETYQRSGAVDQLKKDLQKKGVRLILEENQFKITVKGTVNQATRLFEVWVTLTEPGKASQPKSPRTDGEAERGAPPEPNSNNPNNNTPGSSTEKRDSGIRVTFMRIL